MKTAAFLAIATGSSFAAEPPNPSTGFQGYGYTNLHKPAPLPGTTTSKIPFAGASVK